MSLKRVISNVHGLSVTGAGVGPWLSVSGRALPAAGVSGPLLHMICEGYTAGDRCAFCIFVFNHNIETSHLLGENSVSLMKHPFM